MSGEKTVYRATKRAFDIAASALGLVVTCPVWLAAVIGIELSDPGPVFYMANRVGFHNEPFRMFKFRSMRVDAEKDGVARLSTGENDDLDVLTGAGGKLQDHARRDRRNETAGWHAQT